jgi:hypothetical protein
MNTICHIPHISQSMNTFSHVFYVYGALDNHWYVQQNALVVNLHILVLHITYFHMFRPF